MDRNFQQLRFDYVSRPGVDKSRHPVIIVGAGPVGLCLAIDLAQRGIATIVLDDDNKLSAGSRAICFAKRTLEIFDRLHCGEPMVDKGVSWNIGKVFFRDAPVYSFDLLAEEGHRRPAFINLQQYYVEGFLHERAAQLAQLDIRWQHKVTGVAQSEAGVVLSIETPDGGSTLHADYVVAADGSHSPMREYMGLETRGRVFKDRFLIADVKMKAAFPTERWFWFDPPFHPNQSVLLHRQPDNVWRIDFQLGWEADPVLEKSPERVTARVQALLGEDVEFELEWVSVYTFACRRMEKFRHGRVLFAGDAAHGVSPFGARGANSGVQDADNLGWKLGRVLQGKGSDTLLDSYAEERECAADENILHSTRATDFITPKSAVSKIFRNAVLELSKDCPFARRLVNSGRLSLPTTYLDSSLNTADCDDFSGAMMPGAPATDAPITVSGSEDWFLAHVGGDFRGVYFSNATTLGTVPLAALQSLSDLQPLIVVPASGATIEAPGFDVLEDASGMLAQRFDAVPGTFYLMRPDQHVCARWRTLDVAAIRAALAKASGGVLERQP